VIQKVSGNREVQSFSKEKKEKVQEKERVVLVFIGKGNPF